MVFALEAAVMNIAGAELVMIFTSLSWEFVC